MQKYVPALYILRFNFHFYRHHLIKTGKGRYRRDGINNLHYKKLGIEYQYLHTRILVSINETKVMTVSLLYCGIIKIRGQFSWID